MMKIMILVEVSDLTASKTHVRATLSGPVSPDKGGKGKR
jgi:hypothetical protein